MSFRFVDRDKGKVGVLTFTSNNEKNIFFIFFRQMLVYVNTMPAPLQHGKKKKAPDGMDTG
jgi:hypothetical protein